MKTVDILFLCALKNPSYLHPCRLEWSHWFQFMTHPCVRHIHTIEMNSEIAYTIMYIWFYDNKWCQEGVWLSISSQAPIHEMCDRLKSDGKSPRSNPVPGRGLSVITAWKSNYIHHEVWDEIKYPFLNFNGATVEVWEFISAFISHFPGLHTQVGIKVNTC